MHAIRTDPFDNAATSIGLPPRPGKLPSDSRVNSPARSEVRRTSPEFHAVAAPTGGIASSARLFSKMHRVNEQWLDDCRTNRTLLPAASMT